jgi:hypothetical protein
MIKSLLTAAATVVLSGAALAQSAPPVFAPGAPPPAVIAPAPPPAGPADTNTTIRAHVRPDGSIHASTTKKGLDKNGQPVTERHSYSNGPDGTKETHSQTQTDPATGNTETNTTTTINR